MVKRLLFYRKNVHKRFSTQIFEILKIRKHKTNKQTNLFGELGFLVVTEKLGEDVVGPGDGQEGGLDVFTDVGSGLQSLLIILRSLDQIVNLEIVHTRF